MSRQSYIHGYSSRESERLNDQAATLAQLLHHDTIYPPGSSVLEIGCGVGAQTVILAPASPDARFTSVDVNQSSIDEAQRRIRQRGLTNVEFRIADLFALPFDDEQFDHLFICFVLEHLPDPQAALTAIKRVLRPGGSITVIEGDHGSTFFHPDCPAAHHAIQCLIELQAQTGGDSLIGRRLYPLLVAAGFRHVNVSPRFVYADASRPQLVQGFTLNTFTAMVEGVRNSALTQGLIDQDTWEQGVAGLRRAAQPDGVFCYTFFKAVAVK